MRFISSLLLGPRDTVDRLLVRLQTGGLGVVALVGEGERRGIIVAARGAAQQCTHTRDGALEMTMTF